MDVEHRVATAILAGLSDRRVNVLCLRKHPGAEVLKALNGLKDSVPDIRFDYWSRIDAERRRQRRVAEVISQISKATDGRSVRGLLSTLYELSRARSLIPKGIQRNGFFYYVRSLSPSELRGLVERSGFYSGLQIGPYQKIGAGGQSVLVFDNLGDLLEKDGLDSWIRRGSSSRHLDDYRMIVLVADFDFPKEIAGLGSWGYTLDIRDDLLGQSIDRFSPVDLHWESNRLAAESRTSDPSFKPSIKPETLSQTYRALVILSEDLIEKVSSEQIDQRVIYSIDRYRLELQAPSPNPITLDCYFEIFSGQIFGDEGASDGFLSLLKAAEARHRAAVSSSEICRDLDRAARLLNPADVPEQILNEIKAELEAAEINNIVDQSVRQAAESIVDLDREAQSSAIKKKIAFYGFVKAVWGAMEKAPTAVKGVEAFQRLLEMASHVKDFIAAHGANFFH